VLIETLVTTALNAVSGLLTAVLPRSSPATVSVAGAFCLPMALDGVLPVHELMAGLLVALALWGALFAFGVARQVWRFVPIIGGG
jgi:hypothetical protein